HGARVVGIHEQASRQAVAGFAAGLWRWPGKLLQAARLRAALWDVPYRTGSHVLRALGGHALRAVELSLEGRVVTGDCGHCAGCFGPEPNVELANMLGYAPQADGGHGDERVDKWQCTSVPNVFAAGEACCIGGVDCALVEGEIAGHPPTGHGNAA